jgi:hypothetical protein
MNAHGATGTIYYARYLPALVRTTLAVDDVELGKSLVGELDRHYPLDEHALCAAQALLAEQVADHVAAANLYAEAAGLWLEFGNVPERAFALLGQGRSLATLRRSEAAAPLREARELFGSMGYAPSLAETEALIGESEAAAV